MKTITFVLVFLSCLNLHAFGRFKDSVKKAMSPIDSMCNEDLYKLPNSSTSPLMKKIIQRTSGSYRYDGRVTSTMLNPSLNWKRGDVQLDVFRGGHEIFSALGKLIRSAEKEVLIQTFIFDFTSQLAQDYLFRAILDLHETHKRRMEKGLAKDPVVVRLIFDIIGGWKGLNLNEVFIHSRFANKPFERWQKLGKSKADFGADPDYEIQFPLRPVLDPKVLRFEIKGHRHDIFPNLVTVTHSKTAVVDRSRALVTGANIIDYHLTDEYKGLKNQELMVDHGFYVFDEGALMVADDFYNLWYKNEKTHRKWSGFSTQYNGNVKADEYLLYNGKPLAGVSRLTNVKFKTTLNLQRKSIAKNVLMGVVGRESSNSNKGGRSPQNDAFITILRNAKSHVNITSPSLNSNDLIDAIVGAVARGVRVNFLLSEHYQDYNWHLQEGGSNQMAVSTIKKRIANLKAKERDGGKNYGTFDLRWFVTRSGKVSGRKANEKFIFKTRVNEKFWNHNHTKFLSADNRVVMVGSANFDEQSWYNSREFNMVMDSHQVASYWCSKVFGVDFLRAKRYGEKLSSGEMCTMNSDCKENLGLYCNNNFFKNPWYKNWKCVYRDGKGLGGSYCEKNIQCKSKKCSNNKCI